MKPITHAKIAYWKFNCRSAYRENRRAHGLE